MTTQKGKERNASDNFNNDAITAMLQYSLLDWLVGVILQATSRYSSKIGSVAGGFTLPPEATLS